MTPNEESIYKTPFQSWTAESIGFSQPTSKTIILGVSQGPKRAILKQFTLFVPSLQDISGWSSGDILSSPNSPNLQDSRA